MGSRSWLWLWLSGLPATLVVGCSAPPAQEIGLANRTPRTVEREATPLVYLEPPPDEPFPEGVRPGTTRDRARLAALRGDVALVRRLLEARVRAGHGSLEDARLVKAACKIAGDRECVSDVRVKYPNA